MEIMQFIFSSFWHWAGTVILIGMVFGGIVRVIEAFRDDGFDS